MASVILLFSLLTPNQIEDLADEVMVPEGTEPRCEALERMLAKYELEYEMEQVLDSVF